MSYSEILDIHTVDTDAGEYAIHVHYDVSANEPYDDGFTLTVNQNSRHFVATSTGDIPSWVDSALRMSGSEDYWPHEYRSGAAIVRLLTLQGFKGVTLTDDRYGPVDASTDRSKVIHGIAWAPDDATSPDEYVRASLREWHSWAEGEVYGYTVTAPDGDVIESVWGFYGDESRECMMEQARDAIAADVIDRQKKASLIGAGFIGLI